MAVNIEDDIDNVTLWTNREASLALEARRLRKELAEANKIIDGYFHRQELLVKDIEKLRTIPKKMIEVLNKYESFDAHSHDPYSNGIIYITDEVRKELKELINEKE